VVQGPEAFKHAKVKESHMLRTSSTRIQRLPLASLGITMIGLLLPWETRGQGFTADPYKPYNQQYEQFVYPTYPSSAGITPNQGILEQNSRGRAYGDFQSAVEADLNRDFDQDLGRRGRSGTGVPYYSAYRQYDEQFGRVYQPNKTSDELYYKDQQKRHATYLAYLREKDPKKRAELYRAYTNASRKASRDLDIGARGSSSTRSAGTGTGSAARRFSTTPSTRPSSARAVNAASALKAKRTERNPLDVLKESRSRDSATPKRHRTLTAPGLEP